MNTLNGQDKPYFHRWQIVVAMIVGAGALGYYMLQSWVTVTKDAPELTVNLTASRFILPSQVTVERYADGGSQPASLDQMKKCLVVMITNRGSLTAKNSQLKVDGTRCYYSITRSGEEGQLEAGREIIPLGDIGVEQTLRVNVWCNGDFSSIERVVASHEQGRADAVYLNEPNVVLIAVSSILGLILGVLTIVVIVVSFWIGRRVERVEKRDKELNEQVHELLRRVTQKSCSE